MSRRWGLAAKHEIRMSKSETNTKSEARRSETVWTRGLFVLRDSGSSHAVWNIWISVFGFVSYFEIRNSDYLQGSTEVSNRLH